MRQIGSSLAKCAYYQVSARAYDIQIRLIEFTHRQLNRACCSPCLLPHHALGTECDSACATCDATGCTLCKPGFVKNGPRARRPARTLRRSLRRPAIRLFAQVSACSYLSSLLSSYFAANVWAVHGGDCLVGRANHPSSLCVSTSIRCGWESVGLRKFSRCGYCACACALA